MRIGSLAPVSFVQAGGCLVQSSSVTVCRGSVCLEWGRAAGHGWASQVARVVKNASANAGDTSLIPGSGRSPGEGNGNGLQYSCLENPTDRGAWRATVYGVAKSQT